MLLHTKLIPSHGRTGLNSKRTTFGHKQKSLPENRFQQGEIDAQDRLASGEAEYRLISSYPEFASLFRRPGEGKELDFERPNPA